MIKQFYIQVNETQIITDILEFPYQDYIEVQLNTPIPPRIMSGCYKLVNGEVVYIQNLDEDELSNKISILTNEINELKEFNTQLIKTLNGDASTLL